MKTKLFGIMLVILVLSTLPLTKASAQSPTPAPATITVTILGKDGQPLVGVAVTLTLVRYGDAVEYLPGISCLTDAAGQCVFEVADAPRLRSGRAEALVEVGSYGEMVIGWKGERAEATITLTDLGLQATIGAPLDAPYEGQTEQPTDGPVIIATSTPTLAPSATPIPATLTVAPSDTPLPPTVTPLPAPSATDIPLPTATPPPAATERMGLLPIGCGVIAFAVVGVGLFVAYRKQKSRQGA